MSDDGEQKQPAARETFSDRVFRVMAHTMPAHLAYALGACKHRYGGSPAMLAMLRAEGLADDKYSWLTSVGDRLAEMLEPPELKAAAPEPDSTPEPTPAPAELEQPAAPTFVPEPDVTPPGVPDVQPPAAIDTDRWAADGRITIGDAVGIARSSVAELVKREVGHA